MTSIELAKASAEKISRCLKTFFGALLASRSVGERLTRSTRTIVPAGAITVAAVVSWIATVAVSNWANNVVQLAENAYSRR